MLALCGICALLAVTVAIVFGPALGFGFLGYDDNQYVNENPHITGGLNSANAVWAFTHTQVSNWHPITSMSHMLDCSLYGLNAGGHHATSVALHAASAILLFLLLRQMTGALGCSALVAALFAIHPLRVESVAWISERKDVLSGFFFMLTLCAYVRYVRKGPSWGRYACVAVLFALGLMSKPMLVTLPCVLLLLDYWPLRRVASMREQGRSVVFLIVEKLPLFALSAACCAAALVTQKQGGAMGVIQDISLPWRIGNAFAAYAVYLQQTIYPADLSAFYPHPGKNLSLWTAGAGFVLVAGVSLVAVLLGKKRPWLPVGWFWYVGMLMPVIGIVQVGGQAHADRYTYLPQIGILIVLAWTAAEAFQRAPRGPLWCASGVLILGMAWCARQQVGTWRDTPTLWLHALATNPNNATAHNNLGFELVLAGHTDEGVQHLREALRIRPDYPDASCNLGSLLGKLGRLDEAEEVYRNAIAVGPPFAPVHHNYANLLAAQGRAEEAVAQYRQALKLEPDMVEAYSNLGIVLAGLGRLDEAIASHRQALQLRPDDASIHNNLAVALLNQGQVADAIGHYRRALEIKPEYVEAAVNLAGALAAQSNVDEALKFCRQAEDSPGVAQNPAIPMAIASVYARVGRLMDAARLADRASDVAAAQGDAGRASMYRSQAEAYRSGSP